MNDDIVYRRYALSEAGESAYDVDELTEDVMSSVPARSSVDSSLPPPAPAPSRYYDPAKPDSFDSYDVSLYDAAATTTSRKDSGYQTFNQPPPSQPPPVAELPYFNHVDSWQQQPPPAADAVPITVIDAQAHRQSFVVGRESTAASALADQRHWPPAVSSPATYSDGLPSAPAFAAGFCDTLVATSSVDSASIGSVSLLSLYAIPADASCPRAFSALTLLRQKEHPACKN